MPEPERDAKVRQAAFEFLSRPELASEDGLVAFGTLQSGFAFEGERVPMVSMQGIFKPRAMRYAPLTILSSWAESPSRRPYDDTFDSDGQLVYRYRRDPSGQAENRGLQRCFEERLPLIYLEGEARGLYRPYFPVFVVGDDPHSRSFLVDLSGVSFEDAGLTAGSGAQLDRRYRQQLVLARVHQRRFRAEVLAAYDTTCSVCHLQRHRALIDAAHIAPDSAPSGVPTVPNALALCKLHHAAFDNYLIGVRPDLTVQVRGDILREADGPMLIHGLQELQDRRLRKLPSRHELYPDPEFLDERFQLFKSRGA